MAETRECLIAGRTGAGKTLLLLNFAEYCGVTQAELRLRPADGPEDLRRLSLAAARAQLVGPQRNQTRCLQSLELTLPRGKGRRRCRLTDTAGLTDGIPEQASVRRAVAQSLRRLRQAAVVLHVLDASALGERGGALPEVDLQVARYAPLRAPYAALANKLDLPWAGSGLEAARHALSPERVLGVSALERRGFAEVKGFVWDHL